METEKTLAEKFKEKLLEHVAGLKPIEDPQNEYYDIDNILFQVLEHVDSDAEYAFYHSDTEDTGETENEPPMYKSVCFADRSSAIVKYRHASNRFIVDVLDIAPTKRVPDAERMLKEFRELQKNGEGTAQAAADLVEKHYGKIIPRGLCSPADPEEAEFGMYKLRHHTAIWLGLFEDWSVVLAECDGEEAYVHRFML